MALLFIEATDKGTINALNAKLKGLGLTAKETGGSAAIGFGQAAVAGVALSAGLAAVQGAASGVKTAIDNIVESVQEFSSFEQGLRNVQAVSGATDAQLKQLSVTSLNLASATRYTAQQVNEGLYGLASAGFSVQQQIGALPGVLNLAEAAQADLGLSTELVTRAIKAWQLEASAGTQVADVYTAAIASSSLTAERLGNAMVHAAPAGAIFNQSIEETTAAVALMTNVLGKGEVAGTAYKTGLATLSQKSDELGISVRDAAGNFKPLVEIIRDLERAGKTGQDVIDVLGKRAGPGFAVLLQAGSRALEEETERIQSNGQAAETAGKQLDTLKGDTDILRSNTERLRIELGEGLSPAIRTVTQDASKLAQSKEAILFAHLLGEAIGDLATNAYAAAKALPPLLAALPGFAGLNKIFDFGALGQAAKVESEAEQIANAINKIFDDLRQEQQKADAAFQKSIDDAFNAELRRQGLIEQSTAVTVASIDKRIAALRKEREVHQNNIKAIREYYDGLIAIIDNARQSIEDMLDSIPLAGDLKLPTSALPSNIPIPDFGLGGNAEKLTDAYLQALKEGNRKAADELYQAVKEKFGSGVADALRAAYDQDFQAFANQLGEYVSSSLISAVGSALESGDIGQAIKGLATNLGQAIGLGLSGGNPLGGQIGALGGSLFGSLFSQHAERNLGSLSYQAGQVTSAFGDLSGAVQEINDALEWLKDLTGASVELAGDVAVTVKEGGAVWVNIGDGISLQVGSIQEAIDRVKAILLKGAKLEGLPDQVAAVLEHSTAQTFDELKQQISFALDIAHLDMGPVGSFFFDLRNATESDLRKAFEYGIDPSPIFKEFADRLNQEFSQLDLAGRTELFQSIDDQRKQWEQELQDAKDALAAVEQRLAIFLNTTDMIGLRMVANLRAQETALQQQIAQLEGELAALPTSIPHVGGGGGRKQQRKTIRDQVTQDELSALGDFERNIYDITHRMEDFRESIRKLGFSADEAADLIAREQEVTDQQVADLVGGVQDGIDALAPSAGALSDALAATSHQAAALDTQLRALHDAGLLTDDAFAEMEQQLQANAAAAQQVAAQGTAEDLLGRALDFLGRSDEAAQFRFELEQAQLLVAIEELRIRTQELGLTGEIYDRLFGLAGDIAALEYTPPDISLPVDHFNSAVNDTANALEQLRDEFRRAKQSIHDLIVDITENQYGGLSPEQALRAAQSQYDEIVAAARNHDLGALQAVPQATRDLLEALRNFSPAALGTQLPGILDTLHGLENLNTVRDGNLVVVDRFGEQYHRENIQELHAGFGNLGTFSAQQLETQRQMRQQQVEMTDRLTTIAADLRRYLTESSDPTRGTGTTG